MLPGAVDYESALAAVPDRPLAPATGGPDPDDLHVLYTGGTTGMPKGALWRQGDLYVAALGGDEFPEHSDDTIALAAAARHGNAVLPLGPLMHGAAHWIALRPLLRGNTAAFMGGRFPDGGTRLHRRGTEVYRAISALAAFAERTVVPAPAAVKVPADTPLHVAAVLGCALQTGIGAVLSTARAHEGDTVAIIGLGGIGTSIAQGARLAGAQRIIGIDPVASRRAHGLELGLTHALDPATDDVNDAVRTLTGGIGSDHTFDAVGGSTHVNTALSLTRRGGNVIVVGAAPPSDRLDLGLLGFLHSGRTLRATNLGDGNPHRDIPRLLALGRAGRLDLERLITRTRPLDEINQAIADMHTATGLRTVITIDDAGAAPRST